MKLENAQPNQFEMINSIVNKIKRLFKNLSFRIKIVFQRYMISYVTHKLNIHSYIFVVEHIIKLYLSV